MIYISHRGNIKGPNTKRENSPSYIDEAISEGFEVEVDVREINDILFLGHDEPQYQIELEWLIKRKASLWVHCKNKFAISKLIETELNIFWHEEDKLTLTSKNYIWVYPGQQPVKNSIAVLPERFSENELSQCFGICSDYIKKYKDENI